MHSVRRIARYLFGGPVSAAGGPSAPDPGRARRTRVLFLVAAVAILGIAGWTIRHRVTPLEIRYARPAGPCTLSVLFVGNSFSYYHDWPGMLVGLLRKSQAHADPKVSLICGNGLSLRDHLRSGVLRRVLEQEGLWQYVVLQEQGGLPFLSSTTAEPTPP